jgi:hypothetical protein
MGQHEHRLIMKSNMHEQHIPHESERPLPSTGGAPGGRKAGTTQPGMADADKRARTGKVDEPVRSTPPAGSWNDVASNE